MVNLTFWTQQKFSPIQFYWLEYKYLDPCNRINSSLQNNLKLSSFGPVKKTILYSVWCISKIKIQTTLNIERSFLGNKILNFINNIGSVKVKYRLLRVTVLSMLSFYDKFRYSIYLSNDDAFSKNTFYYKSQDYLQMLNYKKKMVLVFRQTCSRFTMVSLFNGISTFSGYLMPKSSFLKGSIDTIYRIAGEIWSFILLSRLIVQKWT